MEERRLLLQSLEQSRGLRVPRDFGVRAGRGDFTVCALRSDLEGLDSQCELFCCTEKPQKRQEVKEKVSVHEG